MLKLKAHECIDLNIIGLMCTGIIAFIIVFFPLSWKLILLLEVFLLLYAFYLLNRVKSNQYASVLINIDHKWFVSIGSVSQEVNLKDYWILSGLVFFWLKGDKFSVSFVVSRSIIGAQKFSQLRAIIL